MTRTLRLAALLLWCAACQAPGKGMLALEGATLIDGSGGPPVKDALLLIRNGHIEAVSQVNEIAVPRGATRISLVGKTIIPGLVDAHAHAERWALPRYLAWGVTTIRDMGGDSGDTLLALRSDANLGSTLGPRMFTSGAAIDGAPPTYPTATGVVTAEEARRAVDGRVNANVDYLEIHAKITPALFRPLMDEASSLRTPVMAHLGKIDALAAARAGVVSIEALSGVVQAAVRNPGPYFKAYDQFLAGWAMEERGWASLDDATISAIARELAATHVAMVPTLVLHETMAHLADTALASRAAMADVPAGSNSVRGVAGLLQRAGWTARDFAAFRQARAKQDRFVREFRHAGGLIAAGTDAASPGLIPGEALHEEMALLVGAGFTPLEAITAATRYGAHLMHADSLGMILKGNVADFVVLNADPSQGITATRDIAWVMIRGNVIHPDSLRAQWTHDR